MNPIPGGLGLHDLPRKNFNSTRPAVPTTFGKLCQWEGFDALLQAVAATLDTKDRKFLPALLPGHVNPEYRPPGDEIEVRAGLLLPLMAVSSVCKQAGIPAELIGGGRGRSVSAADYVVRRPIIDDEQQALRHPKTGEQRPALSEPVLACVEVNSSWQRGLRAGADITALDEKQLKKISRAIQQCYGYMVMDEVPMDVVTCHDLAIFLKRSDDVKDKTLYTSPVIGVNKMLLALYTLLKQADKLAHLKQVLKREQVPIMPLRGHEALPDWLQRQQPLTQLQQKQQQEQQQQQQQQQVQGQEQQATAVCPDMQHGQPHSSTGSSSTGSSSSSSSSGDSSGTVSSRQKWCIKCPSSRTYLTVELYGFDELKLTDKAVGFGQFGPVLQGAIGGEALAVKVFDSRREGAIGAWLQECSIYQLPALKQLQGDAVPTVRCSGMFAHTGSLFIAMADEGFSLHSSEPISPMQQEEMMSVVRKLHSAGVLHGNIRLPNFVSNGQQGGMRVIDFEQSKLLSDLEPSEWEDKIQAELQAVGALCAKAGQAG